MEYDPGDTANKQQGRTETGESGSAVPTLHHGKHTTELQGATAEERGSGSRKGRSMGKLSARVQSSGL